MDIRDDLSAYTDWFADRISKFGRARVNYLTMDLVRVAGVVLEHICDFTKIVI